MLAASALLLLTCATGQLSDGQTSAHMASAMAAQQAAPADIRWTADLDGALKLAKQHGVPVLVHFSSDHCPPCRTLEQRAFKDPRLVEAVHQDYIPVLINVEKQRNIAQRYSVVQWPTDVLISATGQVMHLGVSPQDPQKYVAVLKRGVQRNSDLVALTHSQSNTSLASTSNPGRPQASPDVGRIAVDHRENSPFFNNINNTSQPETARTPSAPNFMGNQGSAALPPSEQLPTPVMPAQAPHNNPLYTQRSLGDGGVPAQRQLPPVVSGSQNGVAYNPWQISDATPLTTSINGQTTSASQPASSSNMSPVKLQSMAPVSSNPFTGTPTTLSPSATTNIAQGQSLAPDLSSPIAGEVESSVESPVPSQPEVNVPVENTSVENSPIQSAIPGVDVILDGHCPVTLQENLTAGRSEAAWQLGDERFAVRHRGKIYWMKDGASQEKFLATPDQYAAILSGFDLVIFLTEGKLVPGSREFGFILDNHLYLFASRQTKEAFGARSDRYTNALQELIKSRAQPSSTAAQTPATPAPASAPPAAAQPSSESAAPAIEVARQRPFTGGNPNIRR